MTHQRKTRFGGFFFFKGTLTSGICQTLGTLTSGICQTFCYTRYMKHPKILAAVIVIMLIAGAVYWQYQSTTEARTAELAAAQQALIENGGGHLMFIYKPEHVAAPDITARTTPLLAGTTLKPGDLVILTQTDRAAFAQDFNVSTGMKYDGTELVVLEVLSED
ncbi:MAG: hypothetical protein JWO43_302 [Candidatus Adlerbacteria bacterium]|nr:hypothetical protein [Candidatus Adlerbacteria bacterium]